MQVNVLTGKNHVLLHNVKYHESHQKFLMGNLPVLSAKHSHYMVYCYECTITLLES